MVGRSPFALTYHPFSFSSSAQSHTRVEFTIRSYGAFTSGMHDLPVGQSVYLDGPWGRFRIDPDPRHRLAMVAAGIGVTPMVSMLKTLADHGDQRECVLVLGNRTEADVPCAEDLETLRSKLHLRIVHVLSAPAPEWSGARGRVGEQVLTESLPGPHEEWQFFVCGPPAMMDTVEGWLTRRGVAPEQVHSERFTMA